MSFVKLKRRLQALINRKDVTDALAGDFITEAVADLERVLRVGAMEVTLTQSDWDGTRNALILPSTYLEQINLFTDTGELTQIDMAGFIDLANTGGSPTHFVKVGQRLLLRPTPRAGLKVYLHFYAETDPLITDTDSNVWTQAGFNATLYTAAATCADFYQMEDVYAARFSQKAAGYVEAIRAQALDEHWAGRIAIPPPSDLGSY